MEKPEITIAEAMEKRQKLLDELNSDAHYRTHRNHQLGLIQPVPCDTCHVAPTRAKVSQHNNRWDIHCPECKKRIQHPQSEPWKALLLWSQVTTTSSPVTTNTPLLGRITLLLEMLEN